MIPDEGCVQFTDNMMMPQKPPHPYAAETMMNYVYDPLVAAKIAAVLNYVTPVNGAQAAMQKINPKLATDQLIFPNAATRAKIHPYVDLTAAEEQRMNDAMQKVIGA